MPCSGQSENISWNSMQHCPGVHNARSICSPKTPGDVHTAHQSPAMPALISNDAASVICYKLPVKGNQLFSSSLHQPLCQRCPVWSWWPLPAQMSLGRCVVTHTSPPSKHTIHHHHHQILALTSTATTVWWWRINSLSCPYCYFCSLANIHFP